MRPMRSSNCERSLSFDSPRKALLDVPFETAYQETEIALGL